MAGLYGGRRGRNRASFGGRARGRQELSPFSGDRWAGVGGKRQRLSALVGDAGNVLQGKLREGLRKDLFGRQHPRLYRRTRPQPRAATQCRLATANLRSERRATGGSSRPGSRKESTGPILSGYPAYGRALALLNANITRNGIGGDWKKEPLPTSGRSLGDSTGDALKETTEVPTAGGGTRRKEQRLRPADTRRGPRPEASELMVHAITHGPIAKPAGEEARRGWKERCSGRERPELAVHGR